MISNFDIRINVSDIDGPIREQILKEIVGAFFEKYQACVFESLGKPKEVWSSRNHTGYPINFQVFVTTKIRKSFLKLLNDNWFIYLMFDN